MRTPKFTTTKITADNEIWDGQSIERYVEQCETTNQPIEGGAPIIYTARKDGIIHAYNIRTDRFELAQEAMDKVSKSITAKRAEYLGSMKENETQETTETNEQSA